MDKFKLTVPVTFIVFNRLDCTQEVFERIREAKPIKLYVVSDGPRDSKIGEEKKVEEVRNFIKNHIDWECEVKYRFAHKNLGCKYNIYTGLNWVFEQEEKSIIIEDDCVPSMDFFRYCQELLNLYEKDEKVWLIGGTNLIRKEKSLEPYFFTKFPDIWGWATWRRAWTQCDIEMDSWEKVRKSGKLKRVYDFWSYRCYLRVANHQINLKRDSWDVPWIYTMHYKGGVGITPKQNLVSNVGCGREDATNTTSDATYNYDFTYGKAIEFPLNKIDEIIVDEQYDKEYLKERWGWNKEKQYLGYLLKRLKQKLLKK